MIEQLWSDNLMWRILELPIGWRLWIFWLMAINTLAFAFLAQREGRITAVVWVGNVATMMSMYWLFGYVRLLGLSHVIWWTPLLIWLIPKSLREKPQGRFALWLKLLIISNLASLAIDYVDVARWVLGDRAAG